MPWCGCLLSKTLRGFIRVLTLVGTRLIHLSVVDVEELVATGDGGVATSRRIGAERVLVLVADEDLVSLGGDGSVGVATTDVAFEAPIEQGDHGLLGALIEKDLVEDDALGVTRELLELVELFDHEGLGKLGNSPGGFADATVASEDDSDGVAEFIDGPGIELDECGRVNAFLECGELALLSSVHDGVDIGDRMRNEIELDASVLETIGMFDGLINVEVPVVVLDAFLVELHGFNVILLAVGLGLVTVMVYGADGLGPEEAAAFGNVGMDNLVVKKANVGSIDALLPPHENMGVPIWRFFFFFVVAILMDKR